MKYLLMVVLAGLFVVSPAFAERDDDEREEKRERREKHDRDDDDRDDDGRNERRERKKAGKRYEKRERRERNPWKILQNISSEERQRLSKLHATNPEAFKKEIAKIVKRLRAEKQKLNKKIRNLVSQYKNAKDDKTKQEAMQQLRKITRNIFLEKMQKNKKRLESLEKHVKKLRQQYDFRQKNADKIIQSRLNTLTSDTKFDW